MLIVRLFALKGGQPPVDQVGILVVTILYNRLLLREDRLREHHTNLGIT